MKFEIIRKLFNVNQDNGFSEEDICEACKKHGSLPLVLQEYYRQLGNYEQINRTQNDLCYPSELIETNRYLVFYKENEHVVQWAIKKSDLNKDNPPVYCLLNENECKLESENLLDFLYAMAYFQAASFGLEYYSDNIYTINEEQSQIIKNKYKKIDYELHQWMNISFYGNYDDEVICMIENRDYDMLYGSSNREHFDEMNEFMGKLELDSY
ncbi:MAG: hypothetical protein Q8900_09020 [Bacillota bacterium]|nr:hypothetical protein [Bacillota bacterium]